jgi:type IV secretion system protein TrbL
LGAQIFRDLANNIQTTNASLFTIIGSAIVLLALTKIVPDMVQGLINGTSFGGGGALSGGVAGAAAMAGGAVVAAGGAGRLASAQLAQRDAQGNPPAKSSVGRAAWVAGSAAYNLGSALARNIGHRLGGRAARGGRFGQSGMDMHERANRLREDQKKSGGEQDKQ